MEGSRTSHKNIRIFEVCLRDGLQNIPKFIPTYKKRVLLSLIASAGFDLIEATSFVHPKWVPQMKDAVEICNDFHLYPGRRFSALVPNYRGFELALEHGLKEVVTIISSSESHNKKNLNKSIAESLEEIERIGMLASSRGVKLRSYIATAFGCPMEGDVPEEKVIDIAEKLKRFGAYEVSIGDTTGMAVPEQVNGLMHRLVDSIGAENLALHLHQSPKHIEFDSILAGLESGITTLDAAVSGLGGCPYAPGATGNIAAEHLVRVLHANGYETGLDQEKVDLAALYANELRTEHERIEE